MIEMEARFSSFRRATHMAQLIQMRGVVAIPVVILADPVMTHIVDDGFVLRGTQLHVEGKRTYEYQQVWRVTLALAGPSADGSVSRAKEE